MPPRKRYQSGLFLFLLFFITKVHIYAQMSYEDYKPEQKQIIINDQFSDAQANNWSMEKKGDITDGKLIINAATGTISTKRSSFRTIQLDQLRDFEIETFFEYNLRNLGSVSIILGRISWNFIFQNAAIGRGIMSGFWIGEKNNDIEDCGGLGKQTKIFDEKNTGIRDRIVANKFTIRKIGKFFHFFINENYVGYIPFQTLAELKFGFCVSAQKIQVDFVTISYLQLPQAIEKNNLSPDRTLSKSNGLEITKIKQGGKYYALVIGVSKYDEPKLNLDKPEKDAEKIKEVFVKRYSFTDSTTFLLLNPTRQKIISELYRLRKIIGPNDNLLIFYAGHGFWDEDARQGYWWAKDAVPDDPSTWLSNSDLREQIRSIKSAHTLLISDACFSGGIFKTRSGNDIQNASRDIQMLYQMPSRRAITSGTMTAVPDNSVFLEYLSKRLTDNKNKFLSSQQLFDSFRAAVINNSSAVPQDGVIAETGDEGGDFIFILREN